MLEVTYNFTPGARGHFTTTIIVKQADK